MTRRYDPVAAALQRRKDAGVCLICGGKLSPRRRGERCENYDDGRHKQPGMRPLKKVKVRPLTEAQKKVKLEAPPNAT